MKKFSIVVPVFCEEDGISHLISRLKGLEELLPKYNFEFVFVDDGSPDKSLELLIQARSKDDRIKIIKLSRNFGSMLAIHAGLSVATGDCVGIITADLQDPPELFVSMIHKWESGKKVVMAVRADRDESVSQKLFAKFYYKLLSRFALKGYPEGGFDFTLLDKQVVGEIKNMVEKNTNILSLIFWLGYDRDTVSYVRQKRVYGKSSWTFSKKVKLFVDSFVSFSYMPVRFISMVGVVTALLSFLYGIYVFINALIGNIDTQGFAALMSVITFLLGLIMIMLGIIGEYLWRILDEARKRPAYIIDKIFS